MTLIEFFILEFLVFFMSLVIWAGWTIGKFLDECDDALKQKYLKLLKESDSDDSDKKNF